MVQKLINEDTKHREPDVVYNNQNDPDGTLEAAQIEELRARKLSELQGLDLKVAHSILKYNAANKSMIALQNEQAEALANIDQAVEAKKAKLQLRLGNQPISAEIPQGDVVAYATSISIVYYLANK